MSNRPFPLTPLQRRRQAADTLYRLGQDDAAKAMLKLHDGRSSSDDDSSENEYHTSDDDSDTETEALRNSAPITQYRILLKVSINNRRSTERLEVFPFFTVAQVLALAESDLYIFGATRGELKYEGRVMRNHVRLQDFMRNPKKNRMYCIHIHTPPAAFRTHIKK